MKDKIVIGLIGEKGAGKGSISKYLMEKFGAVHNGTSPILKRTLDDLHIPATRDNLIKLALVLKEGFWPAVVIDSLITDIEDSGAKIVIADGIRMHGDVEPFRQKYGKDFYLVYITADVRTRYKRTKLRKEKAGEDKTTFEQFLAEEGRLTEVSIHEIGATADFTIDNSGTHDDLKKRMEEVFDRNILKDF
jgi:dephospho-CoA kinase